MTATKRYVETVRAALAEIEDLRSSIRLALDELRAGRNYDAEHWLSQALGEDE